MNKDTPVMLAAATYSNRSALKIIDQELNAAGRTIHAPCDAAGNPS